MGIEEKIGIDHIWKRLNPKWLMAGGISGVLAGITVLLVAVTTGSKYLGEWSQPIKLLGATFYGPQATTYGPLGISFFMGAGLHMSLSALYGVVFTQLVHEESAGSAITVLGFVTGWIVWIFGCMLFMPSVNVTLSSNLPIFFGLALHLLFGLLFAFYLRFMRVLFWK